MVTITGDRTPRSAGTPITRVSSPAPRHQYSSLKFDASLLHQLHPLVDLLEDDGIRLLGGAADHLGAFGSEPVLDLGRVQHLVDVRVEARDDGGGGRAR